jgi:hypothetical protein
MMDGIEELMGSGDAREVDVQVRGVAWRGVVEASCRIR